MREFNTTGPCVPERHYMVDISSRVDAMRAMVDEGDYFCINRARQYGKTTALVALRRALTDDFVVVSIDFKGLGGADLRTEGAFVRGVSRQLGWGRGVELPERVRAELQVLAQSDAEDLTLADLFLSFESWCEQSTRPLVLIIDEVDRATNSHVFLDFLARLRAQYLRRVEDASYPAFHSVVLAGVGGVKHLNMQERREDGPKVYGPWNIAASFDVRMSFDVADVEGMLTLYEADHATGMDICDAASEIIAWTGGYPFLVSRVCQLVDREGMAWNRDGIGEAVRLLLRDDGVSLFESLTGMLRNDPPLKELLRKMLMEGAEVDYFPYIDTHRLLVTYGFATVRGNKLVVANRIFETLLYDHFLAEGQEGPVF